MGAVASTAPVSTASSAKSRTGVAIFGVSPATATHGETIKIRGVGFTTNKATNVMVKYGDKIDANARAINSTLLTSIVPQLLTEGPVRIGVSFDEGHTWTVNTNLFTYKLVDDTNLAVAHSPLWDKVLEKLNQRLRYKDMNQEELEQLATRLSDADAYYEHYFETLPALILDNSEKIVTELAAGVTSAGEVDIERKMTVIKDRLQIFDLRAAEKKLKIRLLITDIEHEDGLFASSNGASMPLAVWAEKLAGITNNYGAVHTALQIGPWILEWNKGGLVIPTPSIYSASLLESDGPDAIWEGIFDPDLVKTLCSVCVEWNDKVYRQRTANSQHFIDELLYLIPGYTFPHKYDALGKFFSTLHAGPRDYFVFIDPDTEEETDFQTHNDLDAFCCQRDVNIVKALLQEQGAKRPDTPLGSKDSYYLLKSFDRAMWLRHLCDKSAEDFESTDCYFGDPRPNTIGIVVPPVYNN